MENPYSIITGGKHFVEFLPFACVHFRNRQSMRHLARRSVENSTPTHFKSNFCLIFERAFEIQIKKHFPLSLHFYRV
jgi:hypothetical protein